MTPEQELFERAADAVAEIAAILGTLKRHHPEQPIVDHCIEVEKQLRWYIADAKEKLRRNELTDAQEKFHLVTHLIQLLLALNQVTSS